MIPGKTKAIFILLLLPSISFAEHQHLEKVYQEAWCDKNGGVMEVVLDDKSRVDCLTDEYAIEFDFGNKWAEAVGQALYYAIKTEHKPGIVLILENENDMRFLTRLQAVADKFEIRVWTVDP